VSHLLSDLKFGMRLLAKSPGFTLIAILTLALGIGANTSIFSTVDAVLIRPLPYADPDRLAMVWEDVSFAGFPQNTPAPGNYYDWKQRSKTFLDMAATRGLAVNLAGDNETEVVLGRGVSPNFFSVLGVQPAIGRTFTEDEDNRREMVAVIADSLWKRRFGGDRGIIGRKVSMDGTPITVIGVMPPGFHFPRRESEIWMPLALSPEQKVNRGGHYLVVVGRLRPGVPYEEANREMAAIAKQLEAEYPNTNAKVGANIEPLRDAVAGQVRTGLLALLIGSGCVLLIACANIANLLLARGTGRQREMAIRNALGASGSRVVAQALTESLTLALAGGIAGLAVAFLALKLLTRMVPQGVTSVETLRLDPRALAFAFGATLFTGLLCGIMPALQSLRASIGEVLKQGGRANASGRHWVRDGLVVGEIALALVLLAGAGLMFRTLAHLYSLTLGFQSENILNARLRLPRAAYTDDQKRLGFLNRVLEEVNALPGVEGAALTSATPFTQVGNTNGFRMQGQPEDPQVTHLQDALFRICSNNYLSLIKAKVRKGRLIEAADGPNTMPVAVINETMARTFYAGRDPIGTQIQMNGKVWRTIVGVIEDIRERGFEENQKAAVYMPVVQYPDAWAVPSELLVKTKGKPESITAVIRSRVRNLDPLVAVTNIRTLDEVIDANVAGRRQQMALLGSFALLALVLTSIGIYGVLAYAVSQRVREIGVRMALGASTGSILAGVLRHGMLLTGTGLMIGGLLAFWATRALSTVLVGVKSTDPLTYAGVAGTLLLVAMLACLIPAWRAARVDPLIALREE
jgi:putative ABC transport system permease protein